MKRLFIDTGLWIAAISPRDPAHRQAEAVLDRILAHEWQSVHTSDTVVAETLNYLRRKIPNPQAADIFLDHVLGRSDLPPLVTSVLRVHPGRFAAAIERFRNEFDRGLSFTDWTIVVLMEEERIGTLATFDGGFNGQGIEVVPD